DRRASHANLTPELTRGTASRPPASVALPAVPAHVFNPPSALVVAGKCKSIKALADRSDSGEAQHATLEPAHPKGAEVPAIERHGHPHGHNNSGRSTGKQEPWGRLLVVIHGNDWHDQ